MRASLRYPPSIDQSPGKIQGRPSLVTVHRSTSRGAGVATFLEPTSALRTLVETYGEDATAKYAEGLPARIRNGEFSVQISRQ